MSTQVEDIFLAAVEKTGADRATYLNEVCGADQELRKQVELLLRAHADAGSFLEQPASGIEMQATVLHDGEQHDTEEDPTLMEAWGEDSGLLDFLKPADDGDFLGRLGNYEIQELIGQGGMGIVLKGLDSKLNRVVAIKVLSPDLASNAMARKRFLREAQAAASISHDHVVTIHAIDEADRLPHLVMELISGQSLQQRIERDGPLDVKEILRIGKQTASGLAAAHAEGLIHRDIKPANILLENGVERVKITDFGLARAVDDLSITQSGVVAGTPQYMSPEQAQGLQVDHRSDLFSLGCVLYAMCTGRPPFRADSTIAIIRRVCDDTPRPIREVNPDIPEWLVAIIDRLLEKDPDKRFQSAQEVADLLGKYLAHLQHPSNVAPPEVPQEKPRTPPVPDHRNGHIWPKATAAVLILSALVMGITEATDVTNLSGTIIRLMRGEGTVVIEVDDPNVSVSIDGDDLVIEGAGPKELRLTSGQYRVEATKNGQGIYSKLIEIERDGKRIVRIGIEGVADEEEQANAVLEPRSPKNYALSFDGIDDSIEIPKLKYDGGHPLTMEAFVTPEIIESETSNAGAILFIYRRHAVSITGDGRLLVTDVGPSGFKKKSGPKISGRAHLAVVREEKSIELFVDGKHTLSMEADALKRSTKRDVLIGGSRDGVSLGAFKGTIDEVRISNVVRYKEDFTPQAPFHPDEKTVALYHFDEGAGDVLKDASGNGHDGKIVGAKWVSPSDGWLQLFNGRDLSGWKYAPEQEGDWFVKNGILTSHGPQSHLFSERGDFRNFHLRVEARINDGGDSGVLVRSGFGVRQLGNVWVPEGIEAQIIIHKNPGKTATILNLGHTGTILGHGSVKNVVLNSPIKPNEWFLTEVIAKGPTIKVLINGQEVCSTEDREGLFPKGHIVLQHINQSTAAEFRQIEIKELPPENLTKVEKADGRWTNLLDMPELALKAANSPLISLEDGALEITAAAGEKDYTNFVSNWNGRDVRMRVRARCLLPNRLFQLGWTHEVSTPPRVDFKLRWFPKDRGLASFWLEQVGEKYNIIKTSETKLIPQRVDKEIVIEFELNRGNATARIGDVEVSLANALEGDRDVFPMIQVNRSTWQVTEWQVQKLGNISKIQEFKVNTPHINGLTYSPDGRYLIAAGRDSLVRIFDLSKGEQVGTLIGHRAAIGSVAVSSNSRLVATGDFNGQILLWDLQSREKLGELSGHGNSTQIPSLAFSPDGTRLLSGSWDKTVRLWDIERPENPRQLHQMTYTGFFGQVAFSPDSRYALHGDEEGIVVWDVESGMVVRRLEGKGGFAANIVTSPDGQWVLSAYNNIVLMWNLKTGKLIRSFDGHTAKVRNVAFSPDGRFILSGSDDKTLRLWKAEAGKELNRIEKNEQFASNICISPSGQHVATAIGHFPTNPPVGDNIIYLWELPERLWPKRETRENRISELRRLEGSHLEPITSVAISPEGQFLLSGSYDKTVRLWNLMSGREIRPFLGHSMSVASVAFSPDGTKAVTGGSDSTSRMWNLETGEWVRVFEGHTGWVRTVAFSPDREFIVSGSADYRTEKDEHDRSMRLWDANTGKEIRRFDEVDNAINAAAFTPDGKSVVAAGEWKMVGLWDVKSGQRVRRFATPDTHAISLAISPDGQTAATGHMAGPPTDGQYFDPKNSVVCLWDIETGRLIRKLSGHTGPVNAVAFSPDGRFVLSGSGGHHHADTYAAAKDNTLRLWDVQTGEELWRAETGTCINSVAFTPDGQSVVSGGGELQLGGGDGKPDLRHWQLPESLWLEDESGEDQLTEVRRFGDLHTRPLSDVVHLRADEGRLVATASYDGTIRIWDVDTGREAGPFLDIGDAKSKSISASPAGKTIAVGDHAGTVYLWDTEKRELRRKLAVGKGHVSELAFSPDGSRLHVGTANHENDSGTVLVYDVDSGEQLRDFKGYKGYCLAIAPLADGVSVLAGGEFHNGGVWDSQTGRLLRPFRDLPQTPYALTASPDGTLAAVGFRVSKLRDNMWQDPDAPGIWLYDVATGRVVRKLRGHTGMVNCLAWTADGRFLVSGSGGRHTEEGFVSAWDNTLRVWDVKTGTEIAQAEIDTEWGVSSLALMSDGRHVVTASSDNGKPDLRLWQLPASLWPSEVAQETPIQEITLVREFPRRNSAVLDLAITPDGRQALSGGWNDYLAVWDIAAGSFAHAIETDNSLVDIAISPDGRRAVAGATYDKLFFIDIGERRIVHEVEAHKGMLRGLAMSPDGKRVVTGGRDKASAVWDTETGKELKRLELQFQCYVAAFVPDGRHVVLGGSGGYCQLWDLESGRRVRDFHGHVGNLFSAAVSPDGRRLLTGCEVKDPTVRLWDLQTGRIIQTFRGHEGNIWSVDFLPNGRHILSGCDDGTMRVWSLASGREVARATWPNAALNQLAVTPDGRHVLSGGGLHKEKDEESGQPTGDYALRLWRLPESVWPKDEPGNNQISEIRRLEGHNDMLSGSFWPTPNRIVSCGHKSIAVWNANSGKVEAHLKDRLPPDKESIENGRQISFSHSFGSAVSADGKLAATGHFYGMVCIWDLDTGRQRHRIPAHWGGDKDSSGVYGLAFTPEGSRLVTGGVDNYLRIWNVASGELEREFEFGNEIRDLAMHPDGERILVGSHEARLTLLHLKALKPQREFNTNGTAVLGVAISPDGCIAASRSNREYPLRLFDLETGKLLHLIRGESDAFYSLAFSPDSRFLFTGGYDRVLKTYDVKTGQELTRIPTAAHVPNCIAIAPDGRQIVSGGGYTWDYENHRHQIENDLSLRIWRLPEN